MSTDFVEVIAVRSDMAAPAAATTAVRLVGLLPPHWACTPHVERDRVRLKIRLEGTGGSRAVRKAVTRVLADSALRGWREEVRSAFRGSTQAGAVVRSSPAHGPAAPPGPGSPRTAPA